MILGPQLQAAKIIHGEKRWVHRAVETWRRFWFRSWGRLRWGAYSSSVLANSMCNLRQTILNSLIQLVCIFHIFPGISFPWCRKSRWKSTRSLWLWPTAKTPQTPAMVRPSSRWPWPSWRPWPIGDPMKLSVFNVEATFQLSSAIISYHQLSSDNVRYIRMRLFHRVTVKRMCLWSLHVSPAQGKKAKTRPNCLNWCGLKVCRAWPAISMPWQRSCMSGVSESQSTADLEDLRDQAVLYQAPKHSKTCSTG